jgi:hypothetical protein
MLQLIKKHAPDGAFGPEDIRILVAAFEDAWQRRQKSGVSLDAGPPRRTSLQ